MTLLIVQPDLVDWLEANTLLGLGPVHFYSRNRDIKDWLRRYQIASAGGDGATARVAAPISPETYDTDLLMERGFYADQARLVSERPKLTLTGAVRAGLATPLTGRYALDCLLRSTWAGPAEWFVRACRSRRR